MEVKDCPTLEASFGKYIEKETLTRINQYLTDEFGKQDAEMGIEFIQLPKIFHLHLARFTYGTQTWPPIQ
jgi:hypothetical protein